MAILTCFGYYIGMWLGSDISTQTIIETFTSSHLNGEENNIKSHLNNIVFLTFASVVIVALGYVFYQKRRK